MGCLHNEAGSSSQRCECLHDAEVFDKQEITPPTGRVPDVQRDFWHFTVRMFLCCRMLKDQPPFQLCICSKLHYCIFSVNCVISVCLQYFDTVGWVLRPVKNRRLYNLYCVGGDVKPC